MRRLLAAVMAAFFVACATGPMDTPTEDRPRMGCTKDARGRQERVKVIGEYEHNTSKWLVVFIDDWPRNELPLPLDKSEVQFLGCFGDPNIPMTGAHRQ